MSSGGSLQRIGHYRLGKNLGIGSFGKVRRKRGVLADPEEPVIDARAHWRPCRVADLDATLHAVLNPPPISHLTRAHVCAPACEQWRSIS